MSHGLCPSCGAAVNLAAGQDETNCSYCGTLVKRPEAEAQFAEVKNSKVGGTLLLAQMALEGHEYKEALGFYNKVIEQDEKEAEAWFGRAAYYSFSYEDGQVFLQSCKAAEKPRSYG